MCMSRPARVLQIDSDGAAALADVGGRRRRLSLSLLELEGAAVSPGDWVLANAGLAVKRIDESEAREFLELFDDVEGGSP